ncbi:hypothetical protein K502DRAFT_322897 [Neoconidiobolus thromboides FSU 785]|nr:hypothetical protein K502DRAFT_322897 [Neoconidiobolus thromboides FSU 785]
MLYLGDPSFIENHVVGEKFYPRLQDCNRPGKTKEEVEEQLKEARERFRRYKTNKNNESSGSDAL